MNPLIAAGKPGSSVPCRTCNHEFQQDPCFNVECPVCRAKAGQYCKRPSEHSGPFVPFHRERDLLALKEGHYDHVNSHGDTCGPQSNEKNVSTQSAADEKVANFDQQSRDVSCVVQMSLI